MDLPSSGMIKVEHLKANEVYIYIYLLFSEQYPYPYWVIDTDYRRFAVTWTCIDLFNGSHLRKLKI